MSLRATIYLYTLHVTHTKLLKLPPEIVMYFAGEIKTKNKYLFKNCQKKITSVFSNSMFFKN